jgi:signal transduction histidine kinase
MSRRLTRLAWCGALIVAALAAFAHAQARPENKHVLFIYSHKASAPALVAFVRQLQAGVSTQYPSVEMYEEHLDNNGLPNPIRPEELTAHLAEKYRGVRVDAILVEGTPGLRFVVEHLRDVFPDVPVVYGGAFEPIIDYATLPANVVGRRHPLPFASTFRLAHALQPDAQRVVLVGGATPTDSLLVAEARRQVTPILDGVQLEVYQDWTYDALIDSLRHLPPRTFVVLSDFTKDQSGVRRFIPGDLVASLARVASVPVYGIARNWVGDGIVGGGVMDFADDGTRTARLLIRVLGRHPGDPMPASEVAANRLVVDWRQLQRWDLPESRLPPNTEVLFRPVSPWKRYRGEIIAGFVLLIVESALIALLLHERTRRLRAQRMVEEQRAQVEHLGRVSTLNGLAAAVSHELRQPLAAIRMNAEAGARLLSRTPPEVEEARLALQDIVADDARAGEVVEHYRALLRQQPPVSTNVDLNSVCRSVAKLVAPEVTVRRARLDLQLDPDIPPVRGDPVQLQQALINLTLNALEALTSSALRREIAIHTTKSNGAVEIRVSDTGPGLSPEVQRRFFEPFFTTKPHGLGMGMTIVRTIVERHHGSIDSENGPTGGAVLTVTLPAAVEAAPSTR